MKTPKQRRMIQLIYFAAFVCNSVFGQTNQTLAPGAPGNDAQWASAGKQAVGTSNTLESKVWFTLEGGAMTEVFYPMVDTPNVRLLQFVVVNKKTGQVETERDDADSSVSSAFGSLFFSQINRAKSRQWVVWKKYTTDVERNSILINVNFTVENTVAIREKLICGRCFRASADNLRLRNAECEV